MSFIKKIKSIPLYLQIIASMIIGLIIGFTVSKEITFFVFPLGTLFIKSLKMIIIPLIFTSVSLGVMNLKDGGGKIGKLAGKAFLLFSLTSIIAICMSLFYANFIQPGVGVDLSKISNSGAETVSKFNTGKKSIFNLVTNLFYSLIPSNILEAGSSNRNALAVIFVSILFGVAASSIKSTQKFNKLKEGVGALNDVIIKITGYVISFAPIGIFSLVVKASSEAGPDLFKALGLYAFTLVVGISTHLFIILPLLVLLLARVNPIKHFSKMFSTMLMAFSTSSSGATLPFTMQNLREKLGVSERLSSFIPPLGATINMDGTSLYECVAVLFISQVLGLDLSFAEQVMVVVTAYFAGMGTAAVPSAGFVMIFIVLAAVGLDTHPQVGLIVGSLLAIDRPLDMYRTTANVYSDTVITTIIAKSEGEKLNI